MRSTRGYWEVIPGADHAFLSEEAVQRVTERSEDGRVQGPVAELRLPHALQQVWKQKMKELFEHLQIKA